MQRWRKVKESEGYRERRGRHGMRKKTRLNPKEEEISSGQNVRSQMKEINWGD